MYGHVCRVCGEILVDLQDLKNHMLDYHFEHEKTLRVECKICSKKFHCKYSAKKHVIRSHRKDFDCKLCPKSFYMESSLQKHADKEHIVIEENKA